ncbi:MAG TPA: 4a-hydroxytetrahydrobiopterin dehydratase [Solirubrobacteraceae bacterium]
MATLSEVEVQERLADLDGWDLAAGDGPPSIEREFGFADFAAALAFVNRVGELAEAAGHHPDILLHGWNKVRLTLSTHSQAGLTEADFGLAGQIDGLA